MRLKSKWHSTSPLSQWIVWEASVWDLPWRRRQVHIKIHGLATFATTNWLSGATPVTPKFIRLSRRFEWINIPVAPWRIRLSSQLGHVAAKRPTSTPPKSWSQIERHHGWQNYSSSCLEHQFRDTVMLASRVLQTKPTRDHSPDHAPTKFCMGLQLRQGFAWNPSCSGRWNLRGCVCPFLSPKRSACAELPWIVADNTVQRAHVLAFCVQEPSQSNGLSRACAAKQAPL